MDPLTKEYPELTPYQFASNTPIQAIDLDGLEAFRVIETTSESGTITRLIQWDEILPSVKGVFVDSYDFREKSYSANVGRFAEFSEYPGYFPNFSKGVFEQYQEREDRKGLISFDYELKLTYGSLGANAHVLGTDFGFIGKFLHGDLIAASRSIDSKLGWVKDNSNIFNDTELEFGFEGGYYAGLGYTAFFDREIGEFNDKREVKAFAGTFPLEANLLRHKDKSKEATFKMGVGGEAAIGLGIKAEMNLQLNLPRATHFSENEKKYLENNE